MRYTLPGEQVLPARPRWVPWLALAIVAGLMLALLAWTQVVDQRSGEQLILIKPQVIIGGVYKIDVEGEFDKEKSVQKIVIVLPQKESGRRRIRGVIGFLDPKEETGTPEVDADDKDKATEE